jgi:hypothetical protein
LNWSNETQRARQAIEGVVKDPYSVQGKLMLALEQDRQESVKLSMRTLSGQRETASKGKRAGGKVPFGYARRRRRADGSIEMVGRVGRAKRDKAETIELVLGDPVEVDAVQSMFQWARDGLGYRTIAEKLDARGFVPGRHPHPDRRDDCGPLDRRDGPGHVVEPRLRGGRDLERPLDAEVSPPRWGQDC